MFMFMSMPPVIFLPGYMCCTARGAAGVPLHRVACGLLRPGAAPGEGAERLGAADLHSCGDVPGGAVSGRVIGGTGEPGGGPQNQVVTVRVLLIVRIAFSTLDKSPMKDLSTQMDCSDVECVHV